MITDIDISSNLDDRDSFISAKGLEYLSEAINDLKFPTVQSYSAYSSILAAEGHKHKNIAEILLFPLITGPANIYRF